MEHPQKGTTFEIAAELGIAHRPETDGPRPVHVPRRYRRKASDLINSLSVEPVSAGWISYQHRIVPTVKVLHG
jgi:hypothetical protein